ncbi:MAG TPA: hypothetical protein VMV49_11345 [Candidatus Deferrimicrobium sp.]|nr:hypothetical protein [Candidatus Deferrimicrobium sp.]
MVKLDELDKQLLDIVCGQKCKFYKEGQEEKEKEYQCGAYKILKAIIEEKRLTLDELKKWALKVDKDSVP